jgi:hypothetical protein
MSVDRTKVAAVIAQWAASASAAKLSPEEAVNAASEWLSTAIMFCVPSEKDAHETLNSSNESGHLFINQNWREAVLAQRLARR